MHTFANVHTTDCYSLYYDCTRFLAIFPTKRFLFQNFARNRLLMKGCERGWDFEILCGKIRKNITFYVVWKLMINFAVNLKIGFHETTQR